jgi:hypothetical protein
MSNLLKVIAASGAKGVSADLAVVPCEDSHAIQTFDISDPTNMSLLGDVRGVAAMTKPFQLKLDITNDRAFVVCEDDSVAVIDISNTSSPSVTGALAQEDSMKYCDIDPSRDLVFGADFKNPGGIRVYDVSTPASPSLSGSSTSATYNNLNGIANHRSRNLCFAVLDDYLYAFNVSSASSPSLSGSGLSDGTNLNEAKAIKLDESNNVAFIAINNGMTTVNIANTSSMSVLDSVTDGTSNGDCRDIAIDLDAGIAFVPTISGNGLMCFDISNSSSLSHISTFTDSNFSAPRGVMYDPVAKVAYCSCWYGSAGNKLVAVSCSNTSSMSFLGSVTTGSAPARGALNIGPREATNGEETS